jgi:hypothetical protein
MKNIEFNKASFKGLENLSGPDTRKKRGVILKAGIYLNPIMYTGFSKRNARIIINVGAIHIPGRLKKILDVFEYADQKFTAAKLSLSNL